MTYLREKFDTWIDQILEGHPKPKIPVAWAVLHGTFIAGAMSYRNAMKDPELRRGVDAELDRIARIPR